MDLLPPPASLPSPLPRLQHGKLEMETAFRGRIPLEQRYGSTLVFRCGSPLDPAALSLVSCATAGSIIISGAWGLGAALRGLRWGQGRLALPRQWLHAA